jgi:hypothetical protein
MTTQSGTIGERVARIEGVLEHLATKADLERLRTELQDVRAEMQRMKFTFISVQLTSLGLILAAMRLWM